MTASSLLAWICAALLLQLAAGIGVAMWRRERVQSDGTARMDEPASRASAGAWSGWREFRVTRREPEDRRGTQCSFYLEPVDRQALPSFEPGQFLTFLLQLSDPDGARHANRTVTRCYSISDRPQPQCYRITVKCVTAPEDSPGAPPGASSSHLHDHVRPGDVLRVRAPSGHFVLDPDPAAPVVLIAGGIGITPLFSMLRWSLAQQPGRTVHLYYGVRSGEQQAFKQPLEELARSNSCFHLHVVYSRPGPDDVLGRDYQHAGHVDLDLLRRTLPHGRHQFYVCGPAAMMGSLVPALAAWGVPQQDIRSEAFGPSSASAALRSSKQPGSGASATIEVHFRRSGRTLEWDGQDASLLEFAERHSVDIDSGCRSGACGTCETRLISGKVRYARPPDHDVASGHCLLCVGTPESSVTLEA